MNVALSKNLGCSDVDGVLEDVKLSLNTTVIQKLNFDQVNMNTILLGTLYFYTYVANKIPLSIRFNKLNTYNSIKLKIRTHLLKGQRGSWKNI